MQPSLLSPEFLGLILLAACLLAALKGLVRNLAYLVVNLVYLFGMLLTPQGAISTVSFCLLGFALVLWVRQRRPWQLAIALILYSGLFIYLRNYTFLEWVVPAQFLTAGTLATIGLSFLFFKIVHVLIEVHSGTLGPITFSGFLNYALSFITFPMGPIQRFQDFREQWTGAQDAVEPTLERHMDAVLRILVGLIKVYVIADRVEPWALTQTTDLLLVSPAVLWMRLFGFYGFLYFNFSGYCDVAIGAGSLLGVRPPENFNHPYLARNISDFWLRFHRSLTLWLTHYVFTPAFKNLLQRPFFASRPLWAQNGALTLTMMVSGLWHGTTPAFLLFGLTHGLYFVAFRTWEAWALKRLGRKRLTVLRENLIVRLVSVCLTFIAVSFSFVFFCLDAKTALRVALRLVGL